LAESWVLEGPYSRWLGGSRPMPDGFFVLFFFLLALLIPRLWVAVYMIVALQSNCGTD